MNVIQLRKTRNYTQALEVIAEYTDQKLVDQHATSVTLRSGSRNLDDIRAGTREDAIHLALVDEMRTRGQVSEEARRG